VKGLITLAKGKLANSLSFGSNGIGTSAQLAGDMLNHMAGIGLQHVPYNGASKMYTDIIGGVLPMGFSVVSSAESFVKAGQMKVLGVTSAQRSALFPQWPAIAETLPGYEAVNWAGFCGPAAMPPHTVQRIGEDLQAIVKEPGVGKALAGMGIDVAPQGPAEFAAFIQSEIKRFSAITKPLGPRQN